MIPAEPSRRRWLMISMVFAATVINYLDRQTLSVLAPVLRVEFGMSNVDYSRVVSAFMVAYTIMNGVSGPMIDRLGDARWVCAVRGLVVLRFDIAGVRGGGRFARA